MRRLVLPLVFIIAMLCTQQAMASPIPWNVHDSFSWIETDGSTTVIHDNQSINNQAVFNDILLTRNVTFRIQSINQSSDTVNIFDYPIHLNYNMTSFAMFMASGMIKTDASGIRIWPTDVVIGSNMGIDFSHIYDTRIFLQPDWATFNSMLTTSITTGKNHNMYDIASAAKSFKFMGKTSVKDGLAALTSDTRAWSLNFDLSGVNTTAALTHIAFSVYTVTFYLAYTSNGVLSSYYHTVHVKYKDGSLERELTQSINIQLIQPTQTIGAPGFTLPLTIITIGMVPILRRKKY